MGQTVRFQETLRRLVPFDEGFIEAGFGAALGQTPTLDARTTALLQQCRWPSGHRRSACTGARCGRLSPGAPKNEITDVLLAIVPVAGLGRVVTAAPEVAAALDTTPSPRWKNQTITDRTPPVTVKGVSRDEDLRASTERRQCPYVGWRSRLTGGSALAQR
jgi:hypothetical protein